MKGNKYPPPGSDPVIIPPPVIAIDMDPLTPIKRETESFQSITCKPEFAKHSFVFVSPIYHTILFFHSQTTNRSCEYHTSQQAASSPPTKYSSKPTKVVSDPSRRRRCLADPVLDRCFRRHRVLGGFLVHKQ